MSYSHSKTRITHHVTLSLLYFCTPDSILYKLWAKTDVFSYQMLRLGRKWQVLVRLSSNKLEAANSKVSKEIKTSPDAVLRPYTEASKPYKRKDKRLTTEGDFVKVHKDFEDFYEVQEVDDDGEKKLTSRQAAQMFVIEEGRVPTHKIMNQNLADFLIIGGGLAGNLLANRLFHSLRYAFQKPAVEGIFDTNYSTREDLHPPKIVIVEKDPDGVLDRAQYKTGIIRSQWTHEGNIKLARQAANFLRDFDVELATLGQAPVDIDFQPQGTLILGRAEDSPYMLEAHYTQDKLGAQTRLYRGKKLRRMFPWLETSDIEMASYSLEDEGTFDVRKLIIALQAKNESLGIQYVTGELNTFEPTLWREDNQIHSDGIRQGEGQMQVRLNIFFQRSFSGRFYF